jgi:hypothetical protein
MTIFGFAVVIVLEEELCGAGGVDDDGGFEESSVLDASYSRTSDDCWDFFLCKKRGGG